MQIYALSNPYKITCYRYTHTMFMVYAQEYDCNCS